MKNAAFASRPQPRRRKRFFVRGAGAPSGRSALRCARNQACPPRRRTAAFWPGCWITSAVSTTSAPCSVRPMARARRSSFYAVLRRPLSTPGWPKPPLARTRQFPGPIIPTGSTRPWLCGRRATSCGPWSACRRPRLPALRLRSIPNNSPKSHWLSATKRPALIPASWRCATRCWACRWPAARPHSTRRSLSALLSTGCGMVK